MQSANIFIALGAYLLGAYAFTYDILSRFRGFPQVGRGKEKAMVNSVYATSFGVGGPRCLLSRPANLDECHSIVYDMVPTSAYGDHDMAGIARDCCERGTVTVYPDLCMVGSLHFVFTVDEPEFWEIVSARRFACVEV